VIDHRHQLKVVAAVVEVAEEEVLLQVKAVVVVVVIFVKYQVYQHSDLVSMVFLLLFGL
jgi:hypothetical protein